MKRIVAAFAGELYDRRGATGRLQSPIFEHRDFERLEMNAKGPSTLSAAARA